MRPQRAGERSQLGRIAAPVVDAVDHGPLNGETASAGGDVLGTRLGQDGERVAPVDRHELVPQGVVGRVQRDGKVHRQRLGRQAADAGHDPHRGQREMPGREAHVAVEPEDRAPDPVVVRQRLPHPHEDDVGDASGPGLAHGHGDLLHDLALGQLALEPGLPGGAELARHGAAGLGRDAHGHAIGIVHQHRLHLGSVTERPEPLGRLPVVRRLAGDLAQSAGGSAAASSARNPAGSSVSSSGRRTRRWRPSQTCRTR